MYYLLSISFFLIIIAEVIRAKTVELKFLKLYIYFLSTAIFAVPFLALTITDGQDYEKYYNILSGRRDWLNAANFYSFEILFWIPEYFLAKFTGPEAFRDINVVFLIISQILICKKLTGSIFQGFVRFNAIQFMFPGTYLLFGNALRQHVMLMVILLTITALGKLRIKSRITIAALPAILVHKSALVHIPILLAFGKKPLIAIASTIVLSIIAMRLEKYIIDGDAFDPKIFLSYSLILIFLLIYKRQSEFLVLLLILIVFLLYSPVVMERLLLSIGPIIAWAVLGKKDLSNVDVAVFAFFAILINIMLGLMSLQSIVLTYGSII